MRSLGDLERAAFVKEKCRPDEGYSVRHGTTQGKQERGGRPGEAASLHRIRMLQGQDG